MQVSSLALLLSLTLRQPTIEGYSVPKILRLLSPASQITGLTSSSFRNQRRRFSSSLYIMSANIPTSFGQVIVVGSANQDLTSYTPTIPKLGQTVLGSRFETSCGGKGANQAVAAAGLDIANSVFMVCRVGNDSFGQALISNFQKVGVKYNAQTITSSEHSTGVAPILVDTETGDNLIVCIPGANSILSARDVRAELDNKSKDTSSSSTVVLTQLEIQPEAAIEAMKMGSSIGACTILNPAPAPVGSCSWMDDLYPEIDILVPNETELRCLVGCKVGEIRSEEDMAKELLEKGVRSAVIVTLGARGALVVSKNGNEPVAVVTQIAAPSDLPCSNDPVEDTVGAGDAFCGALAAYLSSGMDLIEAGTKACGVASMSVRKRGAQSSYPLASDLPSNLCVGMKNVNSAVRLLPPLTFVTGNKKKLEEARQILSAGVVDFPFELTNRKIDLPELQGDPIDIAIEKCKLAADEVNGPVFTEDTSLCFNALNGMPGPYIKWFLDKCGHSGLNSMLTGFEDKTGYAQTIVAFTMGPGQKVHVFDGKTDGTIVTARGPLDFGWDPIFEPHEGEGKTYAEMEKVEKNLISHRGRSFAKFQAFLSSST